MPGTESVFELKYQITQSYIQSFLKKRLVLLSFGCLTIFLAVFSLTHGTYHIPFDRFLTLLMGAETGKQSIVLWQIRIPRIVASLVVGSGLALSGLCIQTLLKNPLASPSTLGISQGAAFGANVAIILFHGTFLSVSTFAFMGAILVTLVIVTLGRLKNLSPEALILAGIALSSLLGAGTTLLHYITDETQLARAVAWTFGDVSRSSWKEILAVAISATALFAFSFFNAWKFNAFECGEETAISLGIPVKRIRWYGLIIASLVASLATAFHGIIAFIGLIAPHIASKFCGTNYQHSVPFACVTGALLLLAADTFGRLVIGSGTFPVGITTSFLGAPLFMYLLVRRS